MQNKRPRIEPAGANDGGSRSVSGGSIASQDTMASQNGLVDHPSKKYAPIRPTSQSSSHLVTSSGDASQNRGIHQFQHVSTEPDELRLLRNFNQSRPPTLDPTLQGPSPTNERPGSSSLQHQRQLSEHYAGSEGTTEVAETTTQPIVTNGVHGVSAIANADKKERKPPSNNATNERELRELIEKNYHRSLDSIAQDVRNAERTQKSEKAKQLFAMRWLREFCRHDKDSVPRNRVYTHYTQRCGTERVDTLNPASFGKLVRVIFPGIQTRRLGVRGESKYHYVSLALVEDPHVQHPRPQSGHASIGQIDRGTPFEQEPEYRPPLRLPADTSVFPREPVQEQQSRSFPVANRISRSQLFVDPYSPDLQNNHEGPHMYTQTLRFTSDDLSHHDDTLVLPNITPFLAPRTDTELADTLIALYRTHCTSLIDSVRYVKEKQFIRLLGTFNGTMTVPVSKLFTQPNLAPWIKWCDWLMYQQIVRFVSQLALQVIPPQVFTMLRNISNDLTDHLRRNFKSYPQHVVQAKLEPATIFAALMNRLLRVNETAHAAANLLINDEMRVMMWQDFVRHVRAKRVIETALPSCGHQEAFNILTTEVRHLLEPLALTEFNEFGTEYQNSAFAKINWMASTDQRPESIIERWATFLRSVPARFPNASTRTVLHCLEAVGNALLRDITVNQAPSFGAWWIAKVWVDEMMLWTAEMGGFLDASGMQLSSPVQGHGFENSFGQASRASAPLPDRPSSSGLGLDFSNFPVFSPVHNGQHRPSSGPPTATFKFTTSTGGTFDPKNVGGHDEHDDSGIGMSLIEEPSHIAVEPARPAFMAAT